MATQQVIRRGKMGPRGRSWDIPGRFDRPIRGARECAKSSEFDDATANGLATSDNDTLLGQSPKQFVAGQCEIGLEPSKSVPFCPILSHSCSGKPAAAQTAELTDKEPPSPHRPAVEDLTRRARPVRWARCSSAASGAGPAGDGPAIKSNSRDMAVCRPNGNAAPASYAHTSGDDSPKDKDTKDGRDLARSVS